MRTSLIAALALGVMTIPAVALAGSPAVNEVVAFDVSKNELPEGLAIKGDTVYVGLATSQKVVTIKDGVSTAFGSFPTLPSGKGFITGLTLTKDGDLLGGLASFVPDVKTGIYKIPSSGGKAELFATAEGMAFPNDFTNAPFGGWLVSDSIAGIIWHVSEQGETKAWFQDVWLKGDPLVCAPDEVGFGIGANGLDIGPDGALYVAVTDRAAVMRIEIKADGQPGQNNVVNETNCDLLEGADGIAATDDGILVAVNRTDQLSKISYDGNVTSVAKGGSLNFPASIHRNGNGWLITNFGLIRAGSGEGKTGLLELTF